MKKTVFTLLMTMAVAALTLHAQSVDDGIKFIYYQKYTSAINTLKQVVASKPKDAAANYWLGQAYLGQKKLTLQKLYISKHLPNR